MANEHEATTFPTGQDVPFPYPKPYPQQMNLMDSVLKSLKLKEDEELLTCESSPRSAMTTTDDSSPKSRAAVWMLESPTGTGKSLSLCCSVLSWLQYSEERDLLQPQQPQQKQPAKDEQSASGFDWIDNWQSPDQVYQQQLVTQVREEAIKARKALNEAIRKLQLEHDDNDRVRRRHRRENALRLALMATQSKKRKHKHHLASAKPKESGVSAEEDFCVADYRSDDEDNGRDSSKEVSRKSIPLEYDDSDEDDDDHIHSTSNNNKYASQASFAETLLNGAALDGSIALKRMKPCSLPLASVEPGSGVRKVIYAARTHSQLSQFVAEFAKTPFAKTHRIVALGGRKSLCANKDVLKLSSETSMTEACLDLKTKCPYKQSSSLSTLAFHTLAHPTAIEEASELGKSSNTCAYYASRSALPAAHVVVMPYSMLLSKETRQAIGLSLQGSIVIVDEAHNLPEALRNLHSVTLSLPVVQSAVQQLAAYVQKYGQRLSGQNLNYIGQLTKFCKTVSKYLEKQSASPDKASTGTATAKEHCHVMVTPEELMIELRLANMNLYKTYKYLERSRLSQKLLGFRDHQQKASDGALNKSNKSGNGDGHPGPDGLSKHISAMSIVQIFIEKLSFSGQEGKVVVDVPRIGSSSKDSMRASTGSHPALRYVLLRPAAFFENVLNEAHALALVGGTLRPFVHLAAELLGEANNDLIVKAVAADGRMQQSLPGKVSDAFISSGFTAFTCDHVVPPSNVLLQCLSTGPTGQTLDFRHKSRSTLSVCDELGRVIKEVCRIVPNGVVVFLPSYAYEACLVNRWKQTGLWEQLTTTKMVHREPKSPQQLEASLQSFAMDAQKGALLFSVIGGKMSEGINFADEMARCVIVVGLPYPDITDPVLIEKMANMDASPNNTTISGQAYYQNLCMRAVNQSVGRAIRHANDYAAILLADCRYQTNRRIWSGLPGWLKKGVPAQSPMNRSFSQSQQQLSEFFLEKRTSL